MDEGRPRAPSPFPTIEASAQPRWHGNVNGGKLTKIEKRSQRAIDALKIQQFDPIIKLVEQYNRLTTEIAKQERLQESGPVYDQKGNIKKKFSAMVYAALIATHQRIASELLPYGYAKVPNSEGDEKTLPPFIIQLTPKGSGMKTIEAEPSGQTFENGESQ